jgi:hypothetical protein
VVANFFKATQLQKLISHNFVLMFFRRTYIHKAISAVLLVLLLFIHSVKLLHTHSSNIFFSNHDCKGNGLDKNDHSQVTKSTADCSICSYQLGKDADDLVYPVSDICNSEQELFNTQLISFHKLSFHTAFENRGPPGIA